MFFYAVILMSSLLCAMEDESLDTAQTLLSINNESNPVLDYQLSDSKNSKKIRKNDEELFIQEGVNKKCIKCATIFFPFTPNKVMSDHAKICLQKNIIQAIALKGINQKEENSDSQMNTDKNLNNARPKRNKPRKKGRRSKSTLITDDESADVKYELLVAANKRLFDNKNWGKW